MKEYRPDWAAEGQDMLRPLIIEGMGKSAKALSLMMGKEMTIEAATMELQPISTVPCMVGDPEEIVAAAYLTVEGNLAGHVMLFFPLGNALSMIDILLDLPQGSTVELEELERSALGEAGNVMGSAFLNHLAETTSLCCRPSPPAVIEDMAGAVLSIILTEAARYGNDVLVMETVFSSSEGNVKGHFWVVPTPELLQAMVSADLKHPGVHA